MAHKTKRAVSATRKATDKRVSGTAKNPSNIKGSLAEGAGKTHLVVFHDRRVRSAGRPKKAS